MNRGLWVGLLVGVALGFLLHELLIDAPAAPSIQSGPPPGESSYGGDGLADGPELDGDAAAVAALRAKLADAEARIAELEAAPRSAGATPAPSTAPAVRKRATPKLPEGIWPVAKRVGAPRELVELAWMLRSGTYTDAQQAADALAKLKAAGKEGLLAFAALSLGPSTGHTAIPGLIEKLEVPDADVILIDLIESETFPHGLVMAMGHVDTQRSRDFLVDWLPKHTKDASMYWQTSMALGRLKEPRGAQYLDVEAITEPNWSGVRGHILYALGQMGGAEAAAKLGQYLSTPHADKLGAAARALASIDKDAARRHAKRLLASDRAKFIHWMDRTELEKLAKDEER